MLLGHNATHNKRLPLRSTWWPNELNVRYSKLPLVCIITSQSPPLHDIRCCQEVKLQQPAKSSEIASNQHRPWPGLDLQTPDQLVIPHQYVRKNQSSSSAICLVPEIEPPSDGWLLLVCSFVVVFYNLTTSKSQSTLLCRYKYLISAPVPKLDI